MLKLASFLIIIVQIFVQWRAAAPSKQTLNAEVAILDRQGRETLSITDGDSVQLRARFSSALPEQALVTFQLDDYPTVVAECSVPAGQDSCQSAPLFSLGWYWDAAGAAHPTRVVSALVGGTLTGQSSPLAVRPRPVVFVHGFISSAEAWATYTGPQGYLAAIGVQGFAVGDGQAPGVMNTGNIANPAGRTNTIGENADILGQYIAAVKQQTGAQMVDLIAHSMGGLISRYYIDRVMAERDVAQLIMLGSPMGGTDCSALPASLGFYLPGSLEIRTSYIQGVFNPQISHRKGIQFYDFAGTAIFEAFKSPCTEVPNDSVVSEGSVNAIILISSQSQFWHWDLNTTQEVFDIYVRPLLQKEAGSFEDAPDEPTPASSVSPLQFTRVYTGHIAPGAAQELTIQIDANTAVASFALYEPTRSLTVQVTGASGKIVELSPEKNGFIVVDDPSSLLYLGYGFENPKPGPWKVALLTSEATPAGGADYAISVYFVGAATLTAQTSTLVPRPGVVVTISARLDLNGQPLEITQAQAVIRRPDGAVETLPFATGQEISLDWRPAIAGIHGIDVVVTGSGPDGQPVERTAFLAVEVQLEISQTRILANLAIVIGLTVLIGLALIGGLFFGVRRLLGRK